MRDIDGMLQRWAARVTVGKGSGFPTMSALHPNWQPPAPGQTPTPRTCATDDESEARLVHGFVARLPERLFAAVVAYYLLRGTQPQKAEAAQCSVRTMIDRVQRAQRTIKAYLEGEA